MVSGIDLWIIVTGVPGTGSFTYKWNRHKSPWMEKNPMSQLTGYWKREITQVLYSTLTSKLQQNSIKFEKYRLSPWFYNKNFV